MAKLTETQRRMLSKITSEWQSIWDIGAFSITNMTLRALVKAGAVALRSDPEERRFIKWQVRSVHPASSAEGREPGQ